MSSTQKTSEQQRIRLSIMAWMAFYARMAQILQAKDALRLQKKLKSRYQKYLRLKKQARRTKISKHGFFAPKTQANSAQTSNLDYTNSKPLSWRKP